jgi:hypothetical protein
MLSNSKGEVLKRIEGTLSKLSEGQALLVEEMIKQFSRPFKYSINQNSDLLNEKMLQDFGDTLRVHHCYSKQSFTKDKFEYVLERVCNMNGIPAKLAPIGNAGHDITIRDERISLKTEASKGTKKDAIHISKFMEMGQGKWTDDPADLVGLRERFLQRVNACDRILTLRQLSKAVNDWHYELVEIPIPLLKLAEQGRLEMISSSKQVGAKPGYCYIEGKDGANLYKLYFDGGSERKLQVKALLKNNCIVHATWSFKTDEV